VVPYTRYFWKELTDDGRLINASWANPDGYEHSDMAICHFHMKFTTEPYAYKFGGGPRWKLEKYYGLKDR